MGKRFVLGLDAAGDYALKSSHTIGSVSDQFEQNGRGITAVNSLDLMSNPSVDVAMTRMVSTAPKM